MSVKENDVTTYEEGSTQAEEPHDASHPATGATVGPVQPRRVEET